MKKLLIIVAVVFVAMIVLGNAGTAVVNAAYPRMRAATRAFDARRVADGAYEGAAFLLPVSVRVRATVGGGRIASIDLL